MHFPGSLFPPSACTRFEQMIQSEVSALWEATAVGEYRGLAGHSYQKPTQPGSVFRKIMFIGPLKKLHSQRYILRI
jgi:hypothetical protein